jgi:hypothetical protein
MLFIASVVLVIVVVTVVLIVLFHGAHESEPSDVPTWQVVAGSVIAGAGLVLQGFGVVMLWRANRRLQAWSSPLAVLTRPQRKGLLAQVRGVQPIESARVPLARRVAEQRIGQRHAITSNLGLGIAFAGQWIATPSTWRAVLTVVYGLLLAVNGPFIQRDARRARRFLEQHPAVAADAEAEA